MSSVRIFLKRPLSYSFLANNYTDSSTNLNYYSPKNSAKPCFTVIPATYIPVIPATNTPVIIGPGAESGLCTGMISATSSGAELGEVDRENYRFLSFFSAGVRKFRGVVSWVNLWA